MAFSLFIVLRAEGPCWLQACAAVPSFLTASTSSAFSLKGSASRPPPAEAAPQLFGALTKQNKGDLHTVPATPRPLVRGARWLPGDSLVAGVHSVETGDKGAPACPTGRGGTSSRCSEGCETWEEIST